MSTDSERGAASVEHVAPGGPDRAAGRRRRSPRCGLGPPDRGARELGEMIGRRIACAPRHPVPCGRNPLALAYGFPLGKLVRHLAPAPMRRRAGRRLLPVDFRRCRRASCAAPGPRAGSDRLEPPGDRLHLGRGPAARGRRRPDQLLALPADARLGAGRPHRRRRRDRRRLGASGSTSRTCPALVPLETLPGRDHYELPAPARSRPGAGGSPTATRAEACFRLARSSSSRCSSASPRPSGSGCASRWCGRRRRSRGSRAPRSRRRSRSAGRPSR